MDTDRPRCNWAQGATAAECEYHDTEWGVPTVDENTLFEFLLLEGAQAGLSWRTILDKRSGYERAFAGFDPAKVARFTESEIAELMQDSAIVRNKLKIKSAVSNAAAFLEIQSSHGGFGKFIWDFVDGKPIQNSWRDSAQVPASTALSEALSKDLKRRGFKFVGSTIMYSYMQAVGMINDHLLTCFRHEPVRALASDV